MSVPPALPLERVFAPGIRLGWTFRDRRVPAAPYREPQPDPGTLHKQMTERAGIAQSRCAVARRWVIKPSLVAGLLLLLMAGYASGTHRAAQAAAPTNRPSRPAPARSRSGRWCRRPPARTRQR